MGKIMSRFKENPDQVDQIHYYSGLLNSPLDAEDHFMREKSACLRFLEVSKELLCPPNPDSSDSLESLQSGVKNKNKQTTECLVEPRFNPNIRIKDGKRTGCWSRSNTGAA